MAEDRLVKSYKRLDTTSTMEQDAREAFSVIVPFIKSKYPFINFSPIADRPLSRDDNGNYCTYGVYDRKTWGFIPDDQTVIISWKKTEWPSDESLEEYVPVIRLGFGFEFGSLSQLEEILQKNLKLPKNRN
jgi:hypothetical protein